MLYIIIIVIIIVLVIIIIIIIAGGLPGHAAGQERGLIWGFKYKFTNYVF